MVDLSHETISIIFSRQLRGLPMDKPIRKNGKRQYECI